LEIHIFLHLKDEQKIKKSSTEIFEDITADHEKSSMAWRCWMLFLLALLSYI